MIVDHDDGSFRWREAGEGDAVLFLHPIIGTRSYWDVQLDALSDSWRCIALDAPGYDGSPIPGEPLAETVSDWLFAFLDARAIERAHVVGLSLGAMFALHAASRSPDRIGRLVVADTSAAFGIDPVEWLSGWLAPLRAGETLTAVVGDAIDSIVHEPLDVATRSRLVDAFDEVSIDGFETASRYIAEHNVRDRVHRIGNECLVIVGEHDEETPSEYAHELVSLLPNARLEVMQGVGHLTSIEAPDEFSQLVGDHLVG